MAWSLVDSMLSLVMFGTGLITVLGPRWLAVQLVEGFAGNSKEHEFVHTFLLATLKFAGELVCLLIYGVWFWRSVNNSQGRGPRMGRDPLRRFEDRLDDDVEPIQDGGQPAEGDGADQPLLNPAAPERPIRPVRERPRPANPNWPPPIQDPNHFNIALFILPALFDLASQALLFVGLKLTYKDSYFMLRGATLFFTALLSVAFMARPLQIQMWFGLFFGIAGCVCLGLRPYVVPSIKERDSGFDPYGIAAGDLLIVMSFIMNATQAVYEEKFVTKHRINPLLAVGLEGLFGFVVSFFLTIGFSFVNAGAFSHLPHHHLEDPIDAFYQMSNSWQVSLMVIGCILAAPLYTFTGIALGKLQGAMARMVIDTAKTLVFFYILFLAMQESVFYFPQVIGIPLIIAGIVVFNQFYLYIYRCLRGLPPPVDELLQNSMNPLGGAPMNNLAVQNA